MEIGDKVYIAVEPQMLGLKVASRSVSVIQAILESRLTKSKAVVKIEVIDESDEVIPLAFICDPKEIYTEFNDAIKAGVEKQDNEVHQRSVVCTKAD